MTTLNTHEAALLAQLPLSVTHFKDAAQRPDIAVNAAAFLARMRELKYAITIGNTVVRTRAGDDALSDEVVAPDLDRTALAAMIAAYKQDHAEEIAEAEQRRKVRLLTYLRQEGRA